MRRLSRSQKLQYTANRRRRSSCQLNGDANGSGGDMPSGPIPGIPHAGISSDGRVPFYRMDFTDPNFDPTAFMRQFNTDRPVVFVVHGFNERGDYSSMTDYYANMGGEPAPIVIGVHWDSSAFDLQGAAGAAGAGECSHTTFRRGKVCTVTSGAGVRRACGSKCIARCGSVGGRRWDVNPVPVWARWIVSRSKRPKKGAQRLGRL